MRKVLGMKLEKDAIGWTLTLQPGTTDKPPHIPDGSYHLDTNKHQLVDATESPVLIFTYQVFGTVELMTAAKDSLQIHGQVVGADGGQFGIPMFICANANHIEYDVFAKTAKHLARRANHAFDYLLKQGINDNGFGL